jgi:hypothetical protein
MGPLFFTKHTFLFLSVGMVHHDELIIGIVIDVRTKRKPFTHPKAEEHGGKWQIHFCI